MKKVDSETHEECFHLLKLQSVDVFPIAFCEVLKDFLDYSLSKNEEIKQVTFDKALKDITYCLEKKIMPF